VLRHVVRLLPHVPDVLQAKELHQGLLQPFGVRDATRLLQIATDNILSAFEARTG
jgi:hypothetical protein